MVRCTPLRGNYFERDTSSCYEAGTSRNTITFVPPHVIQKGRKRGARRSRPRSQCRVAAGTAESGSATPAPGGNFQVIHLRFVVDAEDVLDEVVHAKPMQQGLGLSKKACNVTRSKVSHPGSMVYLLLHLRRCHECLKNSRLIGECPPSQGHLPPISILPFFSICISELLTRYTRPHAGVGLGFFRAAPLYS